MFDEPVLAYRLVCDGNAPLTNRFVTTRARHECDICAGAIARGQRVRAESRRSPDGQTIEQRRVCPLCCTAIHAFMTRGDLEAINERHALGLPRRREDAQA
ncbi:MAG: hypothetical protein ABJ299_19735 [Nitratireductor sp.]